MVNGIQMQIEEIEAQIEALQLKKLKLRAELVAMEVIKDKKAMSDRAWANYVNTHRGRQ